MIRNHRKEDNWRVNCWVDGRELECRGLWTPGQTTKFDAYHEEEAGVVYRRNLMFASVVSSRVTRRSMALNLSQLSKTELRQSSLPTGSRIWGRLKSRWIAERSWKDKARSSSPPLLRRR
jgi:hypothetical protein